MQIDQVIAGTPVPALGFGTWQMRGEACREGVERALSVGYRHIDTAQAYDNEAFVGEAIANSGVPRDAIWLTTKVWFENARHDDVIRSTEASLKHLSTDYVDLLLLHWPTDEVPLEETLGAMETLKRQGKVRQMGVSNFPPSLMRRAGELAPIFCNQVEYHPFLGHPKVLEVAAELDALVTAYSPLARGRVAESEALVEIGRAHGKSPYQVTLRWLIQQDRVAAIPKAAGAEHCVSNFDVFDFELDDEEMQRIFALDRGQRLIDPGWAPRWEEP